MHVFIVLMVGLVDVESEFCYVVLEVLNGGKVWVALGRVVRV